MVVCAIFNLKALCGKHKIYCRIKNVCGDECFYSKSQLGSRFELHTHTVTEGGLSS